MFVNKLVNLYLMLRISVEMKSKLKFLALVPLGFLVLIIDRTNAKEVPLGTFEIVFLFSLWAAIQLLFVAFVLELHHRPKIERTRVRRNN